MKISIKYIFTCLVIFQLFMPEKVDGQLLSKHSSEVDTNYIDELPLTLTTRLFFSRKFTDYQVKDNGLQKQLYYKPNDRLVVGLGFNYGLIGLNIGIGLKFLETNQDQEIYFNSSYLAL